MNSFKYAFAGRDKGTISIACECEDGRHRLVYADDGVGLPDGWRAGVGIASMRERVAELSGELVIEPSLPHGTRIVARMPTREQSSPN